MSVLAVPRSIAMSSEKYPRKKPNILLISLGKGVLDCAIIQQTILFFEAIFHASDPKRGPAGLRARSDRHRRGGSAGRPGRSQQHLRADRKDAEGRHRG